MKLTAARKSWLYCAIAVSFSAPHAGAVVSNATWINDGNGSWSSVANWSAAVPNATDASASFAHAISAARTITVDSPQTVGTVNFNSLSSYTLAGPGTITLSKSTGLAAVNALSGDHTISAPLTLASDATFAAEASETQTLTISGPVTTNGHTIITLGFGIGFSNIRAAALMINDGVTLILPNGTSAGASHLGSLTIASNSELDLTNNDLQITGGKTYQQIATLISSGLRGGGAPSGSAALLSSTALADPTHRMALGTATGAQYQSFAGRTTFDGFAVNDSDVLVKSTFTGDANLDGAVNALDFNALATHFGSAGQQWFGGDFNYDGTVNSLDFTSLAQSFDQSLTPPSTPLTASLVPEPDCMRVLASMAAALLVKRRRTIG